MTSLLDFYGALPSRVVAKLSGITLHQLRYWHESGLIRATAAPGAPGYPRLWSWHEYTKLRAAIKWTRDGLSTQQMRTAVRDLDRAIPDWYLCNTRGYQKTAFVQQGGSVTNARGQQMTPSVFSVLRELIDEGPLGSLKEYGDVVDMDPFVVSGNPIIKDTRLETRFIAGVARLGASRDYVARSYGLSDEQIDRAIDFEVAIA